MTKTTAIAAAVALAGTLLCNAFAQQPAKIPNVVEANPGRYQISVGGNSGVVHLVDTHTGQCWTRTPNAGWTDLGSPVKARN
jgi:hypothetical protein